MYTPEIDDCKYVECGDDIMHKSVQAMRRALNKAIVTAIDIFVHPDKNVPR